MGHERWVVGVAFSPDGQRLATAGYDGTTRVWDMAGGRGARTLQGQHTGPVNSVTVTPDGQRIITAGMDGTVRLWDTVSGQELRKFVGHTDRVWSVAVTPNGQRIVTGGKDGTARIWDIVSGRELLQLRGHTGVVTAVAVTSDGQRIITGSNDGTARIWDMDTALGRGLETTPQLVLPAGELCCVAATADGQHIATGGCDGTARLWDARNGRELLLLKGHTGNVESVVVIPGTQRLITGSLDGTAAVWDMESGRQLFCLKGHTGPVRPVAVTSDGQRILTGGNDRTARLWDAGSGQELLILRGHTGRVRSVAVAASGQWIVAGGEDGTVKIWEAAMPYQVALWARQDQAAERRRSAWQKHRGREQGFIQDWLVLAPVPLSDGEKAHLGRERQQLRKEAGLRPHAGDAELVDGREFTWQEHHGEDFFLDFNRLVRKPQTHDSVAYAVCYDQCDRAERAAAAGEPCRDGQSLPQRPGGLQGHEPALRDRPGSDRSDHVAPREECPGPQSRAGVLRLDRLRLLR
jgi:WD40 repeat protein